MLIVRMNSNSIKIIYWKILTIQNIIFYIFKKKLKFVNYLKILLKLYITEVMISKHGIFK